MRKRWPRVLAAMALLLMVAGLTVSWFAKPNCWPWHLCRSRSEAKRSHPHVQWKHRSVNKSAAAADLALPCSLVIPAVRQPADPPADIRIVIAAEPEAHSYPGLPSSCSTPVRVRR